MRPLIPPVTTPRLVLSHTFSFPFLLFCHCAPTVLGLLRHCDDSHYGTTRRETFGFPLFPGTSLNQLEPKISVPHVNCGNIRKLYGPGIPRSHVDVVQFLAESSSQTPYEPFRAIFDDQNIYENTLKNTDRCFLRYALPGQTGGGAFSKSITNGGPRECELVDESTTSGNSEKQVPYEGRVGSVSVVS